MPPELVSPTARLRGAWLEAHAEWGPGPHEDGFGLSPADEVCTAEGFTTWVTALADRGDPVSTTAVGRRRVLSWWVVEDGRVLGGAALRLGDDDLVRWAGHVGFGLRPSARGRGLGAWTLLRLLEQARGHGLESVLAVCAIDNTASAATIERCGGRSQGVAPTPSGPARRYWLPTLRGHGSTALESRR